MDDVYYSIDRLNEDVSDLFQKFRDLEAELKRKGVLESDTEEEKVIF